MRGVTALYPLFADLRDRTVLVVGGGAVAERKTLALLRSGARIRVGAPELTPALQALAHEQSIRYVAGTFSPEWLDDAWLVIAATNRRSVNRHVSESAHARRCLVNVVDDPELSSFQVPSVVDRAPLTIAISSAGVAPVLARRLRERMESLFDHALADLAQLAAKHRGAIRKTYPDTHTRRRYYDWLFDGPVLAELRAGRLSHAESLLEQSLSRAMIEPETMVTLVGSGPGDPGLLTLAGLRALNEADMVLHTVDMNPALLSLARRDANVQALPDDDPGGLAELPSAIRTHARMHQRICCLVDPAHGRNAELDTLANTLRNEGMRCLVVPGVASRQQRAATMDKIMAQPPVILPP